MTETLEKPPTTPPRRRRRWLVALAVATAVVTVSGVFGVRWLTEDQVFSGYGSAIAGPLPVGRTMYLGIGPNPISTNPRHTRRVDVRSVTPRIAVNTAGATITVLACVGEVGTASLVGGGSAIDDVSSFCRSVTPFHPGAIDLGFPAGGLLIAITPHRAGVVGVEGAEVSYRDGVRCGRQHVGIEATLTVP